MKYYPTNNEKFPNCGVNIEENVFDDKNEFGETVGRCESCGCIVWW